MARDTTDALKQNGRTAATNATGYGATASNINSVLTPTLTRMSQGQGGYSPDTIAKMRTTAMQGAGGGQAAAVGQAGLLAARSNNAGGTQAAITQAGRDASTGLTDAALGVDTGNAQLQAQQQGQALGELGNLYGTNVGAQASQEGISNQGYNAAEQASQNGFWKQFAGSALNPASYLRLQKQV